MNDLDSLFEVLLNYMPKAEETEEIYEPDGNLHLISEWNNRPTLEGRKIRRNAGLQ